MTKNNIKVAAIYTSKDKLIELKLILNKVFPDAELLTFNSWENAIQISHAEKPDLFLLSFDMAGIDSCEVCTTLKSDELLRHIPVILITSGNTTKENRKRALVAGADGFLSIPVDESELKALVNSIIRIKKSDENIRNEKAILEDLVNQRTIELTEELTERKRAEKKLIQTLDKINRNRKAIMNLMEDLKAEVGERKNIEEKLQAERNLLRTLIDSLPDTIYIMDKECRKVVANKAEVSYLGLKAEAEIIGKTDLELFPGETGKLFHANNLFVLKSGKPVIDLEENFIGKKGEEHWLLTSQYPLYDSNGQVTGLLGTGHDITKRKKAEEELIRARDKAEESDRLKTAFLHNISHEIRTPMNAIIGFSALLSEPGLDSVDQKSFVETITRSSNQLLAIVSDIIEISNIEAGILKIYKNEFNLNPLLDKLYKQFNPNALEKGIEFRYETAFADTKDYIQTDSSKLSQILSNLLNNAFKFTTKGQISFGYNQKNDHLGFYISDTGIGIAEDQYSNIFERFYQVESSVSRQYEGTGLGLPISKAYVELLGGEIWLTSEKGKGSVFYFNIPFTQTGRSELSDKKVVKPEIAVINHKKTVLVAEDEETNYFLMVELLSSLNINLIHARNGKEAVGICESDKQVDLVLMDIKMPVMDGYEATMIIKKLRPGLPVIAQTAYAFESDREKAINAGFDDYISKPFKRESLISVIKKHL